MKVTVVLATYRRDETLRRALQSLTKQTLRDFEVLVADDNADPVWNQKVADICRDFDVIHIVNPVNLGSARNRNHAAEVARGEYLCFLDDDDIFLPDKLLNQVSCMEKAGADVCIEDIQLADEEGRVVETRRHEYLLGQPAESYLRLHYLHHLTSMDTIMFRTSEFLRMGGFAPISLGDDFYLMDNALKAGLKPCYHPAVGSIGTVHRTQGLSSGENKIKCEVDLFAYKQAYMKTLPFADRQYIRMRHYAVMAYAYRRMGSTGAFLWTALKSFLSSPVDCVKLFIRSTSGKEA